MKVIVRDNGLFVAWSEVLSRSFGEVGYSSPCKGAAPTISCRLVGEGLPGVARVNEFFDEADDTDLFVFPDINDGDLQSALVRGGKAVWGSRHGDWLERDRFRLREFLRESNLPVAPTVEIVGIDKLRSYLDKVQDVYVKVSEFRGDFETYHHRDAVATQPWLDELAHHLGAAKDLMRFLVEDNMQGLEVGFDGYSVDGQFPEVALFGYEIKDDAYVGQVRPYAELPEIMRIINSALAPVLQNEQYRNWMSTEIRITEEDQNGFPAGSAFFIDPCCRAASPPGELMMEMFSNWGEVVLAGAQGQLVTAEPLARFGALLVMHCPWAAENWTPVDIPTEDRQFVKLRNATVISGQDYVIPSDLNMPEIGAVIGMGDTLEEAIEVCKERATRVHAYQLEFDVDAFDDAEEKIERGRAVGIDW